MEQICLGIDIGTTNCCVGVYFEGKIHIIPNEFGSKITPSYITYINGEQIIGENAKQQITTDPVNVIYDIKRVMGKLYSDPDIQKDMKYFSYSLEKDIHNKPYVLLNNGNGVTQLYPEEICASYILKMKQMAELYTNCVINNAVITVPAYFNDLQRNAMRLSAEIAGLNVLRIVNEPTAAAIAYNLNINKSGSDNITLVFDMGGGTLDVSILEFTNDENIYNVLATCGDMHLGGKDFDNKIYSYCLSEFFKKNKLDMDGINKILSNNKCKAKLMREIENAKKILSTKNDTVIYVDAFYGEIDLSITLSRSKFENICLQEFNKCISIIENILKIAHIDKHMISNVVLVGGSTRIPKIREIIKNIFLKDPCCDIDPDETVAYGATILGHSLSPNNDGQIILIDVVPMSLGVETIGGIMIPIIEKNTHIPCSGEYIFSTYSDNQYTANLKIYQGNSNLVSENTLLDIIKLSGIRSLPRGIPQIHVKFTMDINGILNVTAYEKMSDIQKCVTIYNEPQKGNININSDSQNRYNVLLWKYKFEQKLYGYKKLIEGSLSKKEDLRDDGLNGAILEYTLWYNSMVNIEDHTVYMNKIDEMDKQFLTK